MKARTFAFVLFTFFAGIAVGLIVQRTNVDANARPDPVCVTERAVYL